jgi:DNA-binding response OmpR family regulator
MNFETVTLAELASRGIVLQSHSSKPVVLIVDDEVLIADTLAAILRQSGFTAMTAYRGSTAMEIAYINPPDLLLTDVAMPGMNGIDLAIAVRQSFPDCKILLFSGQASTAEMLTNAHYAGHDFTSLQKPLHPRELLARISETLALQPA